MSAAAARHDHAHAGDTAAQARDSARPAIGVLGFGEGIEVPAPDAPRRPLQPLSAKSMETFGDLLTPPETWKKWNPKVLFIIAIYLSVCVLLLFQTPNIFWDDDSKHIMVAIGGLGMWRFSWWLNHGIRALIYEKSHYPRLREKADWAWANGDRPRHVHIMMTTYKENPEVTLLVMESIVREVRSCGLSATIWLGSGDDSDEITIANYLAEHADDLDLELVIARQWKSGKRYAIGAALRAMRLSGTVDGTDAVVFMDGDSIWAPGMLQKCVSLFFIDPKLQALTTDEEVICHGPRWMEVWLRMRFAQRRIGMMSHALAGKVLTLTGRLSLFRAHHVIQPGFISILEEDYLQHWLWGRFRFLSGDDKSTWYYMLTQGAKMMYVPDALAITIEHVDGNGYDRMVQNLRRWSGNMLRNGSRAIALGPRKVGLFIWWCVVDQRLAMWTMLVSPILAILTAIYISPLLLLGYILWIAVSRMVQSIWLYCYSRDVHISFPLIIFANQLLNASVKVYSLFRLSKQRWTNRGNQSSGFDESWVERLRGWMASYLTLMSMSVLVLLVTSYAGFLQGPTAYTFQSIGGFR